MGKKQCEYPNTWENIFIFECTIPLIEPISLWIGCVSSHMVKEPMCEFNKAKRVYTAYQNESQFGDHYQDNLWANIRFTESSVSITLSVHHFTCSSQSDTDIFSSSIHLPWCFFYILVKFLQMKLMIFFNLSSILYECISESESAQSSSILLNL